MTANRITATEVLATVGYPGFVRSLFNRSGDLSKDFTHAVLGIVTELHEYMNATDTTNQLEEAGDMMFYFEAARQVLDEHSPLDPEAFAEAEAVALATLANGLSLADVATPWMDVAKRWVGYGKAPAMTTTQVLAGLSAMISYVVVRCHDCGHNEQQVMTANIEKLLERYNGMRFNAERAVHRDVNAERAVLENARTA